MSSACVKGATPPCPICEHNAPNIKKLKTHILLKHQDANLCLFCIEKKGWSDNFATSTSYNEHYWKTHNGTIQTKEKKKLMIKEQRKKAREEFKVLHKEAIEKGEPPPKRKHFQRLSTCNLCDNHPVFEKLIEYERHLISQHGYDYCKICHLLGPPSAVRLHVCEMHFHEICYICGSSSPIFRSEENADLHLQNRHFGQKGTPNSKYICYDCDTPTPQQSLKALISHLETVHKGREVPLIRMRRGNRKSICDGEDPETEPIYEARRAVGVRNATGNDCFAICILQLLAQTDLPKLIDVVKYHDKCTNASCLMAHFFHHYIERSDFKVEIKLITPQSISENYKSFGITDLPVDCGDFLRSALKSICKSTPEHRGDKDVEGEFSLALEWKFECVMCLRYLVMNKRDYVMRIDGSTAQSFDEQLHRFLHKKTCVCGHENSVQPGVKQCGKFVFFEIDRAYEAENDSKELVLYSLQLKTEYNLFGFQYNVFGTVNYNLEAEEGGHYITYLFPNKGETVKIHENVVESMPTVKRKPDFDTDTVIVALVKKDFGSSTPDANRIQLGTIGQTTPPEAEDENHSTLAAPLEGGRSDPE